MARDVMEQANNPLQSDSDFVFQIHQIGRRICHAITTCSIKPSYNNNNNDRLTAFDPGQPG